MKPGRISSSKHSKNKGLGNFFPFLYRVDEVTLISHHEQIVETNVIIAHCWVYKLLYGPRSPPLYLSVQNEKKKKYIALT